MGRRRSRILLTALAPLVLFQACAGGETGVGVDARPVDARPVDAPVALADAAVDGNADAGVDGNGDAGPGADGPGATADRSGDDVSPADAAVTDTGAPDGDVDAPAGAAEAGGGGGAASYQLRVGATMVPADGYSWIPVRVIGTQPDGAPALDGVTLSLSRAGAGLVRPRVVTLTALGADSFFIPCSHADAGCVGTVRVRAELTSTPGVVVAESSEITLTVPDGVGSPAACLIGPNVMFFDGNDYIFTGVMTVTAGTFFGAQSTRTHVSLAVNPLDTRTQGDNWTLNFSSEKLGMDLKQQVYNGAERYPFEALAHPGMDVSGDGRGCNVLSADFQIHTIVWAGNQLQEFVATFDQHCERGSNSLRGCIHYTAP